MLFMLHVDYFMSWRGACHCRFLLRFTGNECEINLLGDGTEKPEFSEWRWAPVEEVIRDVSISIVAFTYMKFYFFNLDEEGKGT